MLLEAAPYMPRRHTSPDDIAEIARDQIERSRFRRESYKGEPRDARTDARPQDTDVPDPRAISQSAARLTSGLPA
jgi:hypothetical protein